MLEKGYVHVYTGTGKGKTTASFGLAFRAMGLGRKTYIGQFLKGRKCAEHESAMLCQPYITIEQYGRGCFIHQPMQKEDILMAKEGLDRAKRAMLSGEYAVVVLDEINTAHSLGLIKMEELLEFIEIKPVRVELVFTGRNAPQELINAADLVTEMVQIKHYFEKGVPARDGIER